jgi:hypothetical protein
MFQLKNLIFSAMVLSSAMPVLADPTPPYYTKSLKNITAGYGSTFGSNGFYILIKATTGELYLYNSGNTGYTEGQAKAYLSVALTGKSTAESVTFNATCLLADCSIPSSALYRFTEIIVGSY